MSQIMNVVITQDEDGGYVAYNPETGVASQGDTLDETMANIHEAVSLYLEEIDDQEATAIAAPHKTFLTTITV